MPRHKNTYISFWLPYHGYFFSCFGQDASQSQSQTAMKAVLFGLLFAHEPRTSKKLMHRWNDRINRS